MSRYAIALFALAAAPALAQIQNGSFETGLAYGAGPNIFSAGTPAPWVATFFTPDLYDNTGVDGWNLGGIPAYNNMFTGMTAADGDRFIGFAASTAFGGINEAFAQTTGPLVASAQYTISVAIAADDSGHALPYGGPYTGRGEVDVYLNNNLIGTFAQNTTSLTWESRSITFTAPNALPGTFEFVARLDPTNGAASYIALDGFRMVPAPGGTALLALGGILAGRRRRR